MSRRASKRDLVGKRITGVSFEEVKSIQTGQKVRHLVRLELDNGTRITFPVAETGCDYAVEATVHFPMLTGGGES